MNNWHHAPAHHLSFGDTFFVTGGTYLKQQFYTAAAARDELLTDLHRETARALNKRDGVRNRRVWYQFRDKTLTFEGSWLARLRYTNENAVHHGIVTDARRYRWCSAATFEETAPRTFVDAVSRVKIDSVKIYDAF